MDMADPVIIAGVAGILAWLSVAYFYHEQQNCYGEGDSDHQPCSFLEALFAPAGRVVEFVEAYEAFFGVLSDVVIATFTVALAIFTYRLWWSTEWEIEHAIPDEDATDITTDTVFTVIGTVVYDAGGQLKETGFIWGCRGDFLWEYRQAGRIT